MDTILGLVAGILAALVLPVTISTFKRTWRWAIELFTVVATLVICLPTVGRVLPVGVLGGLGFCWVAVCLIAWRFPAGSKLPSN